MSGGVYGRSTRKDGGANRRVTAFFLGRVETRDRFPTDGAGVDLRRLMDGTRATERDNGVIKIVVVPVATDPRRVGRIGECNGREPDEQAHKEQGEEATGWRHAS